MVNDLGGNGDGLGSSDMADAAVEEIHQAGSGRFSAYAVFNNPDLELGVNVEYENLLAHKDQLLDMSHALEG